MERKKLILCTCLKRLNLKIIGYLRSTDMYYKVIGTFIERYYLGYADLVSEMGLLKSLSNSLIKVDMLEP
ncbi:IS1 family transposase [Candidatus Enterovibrio escicola]|uniref:IS1 family transposase n=1 Tax=Candidatus Enterovibrio escicola TaxID=1927127 RepID=UPI000BE2D249